MEGRIKKYSQVSPERAKVWTEKSPKYHYNIQYNQQQQQQQHNGKVPVVYYLCRNRQLEHPHFMEVPLSSPDGLYLRDVMERLNVLRGRGMASMYSWSCKRSYKNGYVWHDLCDDDLILPAHGNEYVLKGSELFEDSNSGRFSPAGTFILQNQKALPEPPSSRSQEESSSSSSLNGRTTKSSQDDELSPPVQRPCSSAVSPESSVGKNSSWNGSLSLTEYKVYKNDGLADASTQTEEKASRVVETRDTCTRGVSTDDGTLENDSHGTQQSQVSRERSQLWLDPTYKPKFSHSKFPSPLFSTSLMFGELDCLAENPRLMSMKLEDKEYFSGSLAETTTLKENVPTLQRSSSYNADRSTQQLDSNGDKEEGSSTTSKCIPKSIKASLSKQPRSESMRSPLSEGPRISSERAASSRTITPGTSNGGSKRITEPFSGKEQSGKPDSSRNNKENVIKIEES
ncbi:UNVERIFIED_CONTAM: protein UPSTREAM OF FLC [Sesamum calycinum]|uniref:Protein UPSTREAM OF FLC n=1 Tax=Sesamum calycinum TaxID=2727403 RepID=A0AAW2SDG2_9LAMI